MLMVEDISLDTINSLLKPLRLRIASFSNKWLITDLNGFMVKCVYEKQLTTIEIEMENDNEDELHFIFEQIKNIQYFMQFSYLKELNCHFIQNPYFGCKSLEEALVKKDLRFAI